MRILFIFFALLFSSNSFASNQCKVLAIDANLVKTYNIDIKGLHVGSNFSPSDFTSTSNITNYGYCNLYITSRFGAKRFVKGTKAYKTCKLPQIMNETTGQCETPPDPNFCQSSKFLEIVASESNACAAKYPNHLTNFTQTCVDSKNYSFTCKQGLPKPDPDPDPDPDPKPPGGGGGNG
ncbi:hypothetical protein, partial [Vibrio atlanticus]|uniref:hypothetical protein n=1 Tax=Vibrio atlanticus TaxID=693153 RepID=UPI00354BC115